MRGNKISLSPVTCVFAALSLLGAGASYAQSTNSWKTATGDAWDVGSNWTLGTPSSSQGACIITNIGTKTIWVDGTTSGSANTINNLGLSAPSGYTNNLDVSGWTLEGRTTVLFVVKNGCAIGARGWLTVDADGILRVDGNSGGVLSVDGLLTCGVSLKANVITTNVTTSVGDTGAGSMTIARGYMRAGDTIVGNNDGSSGLLKLVRGTNTASSVTIGNQIGAVGELAVTNDGIENVVFVATNAPSFIGKRGIGFATVTTNGMFWVSDLSVGWRPAATGTVWVAGGRMQVTVPSGNGKLDIIRGALILSNGVVIVDQLIMTNQLGGSTAIIGGDFYSGGAMVSNAQSFVVGNGTQKALYQLNGGLHAFGNGLVVSPNATVSGCGTIAATIVNNGTIVSDCPSGLMTLTGVMTNNARMRAASGATLAFTNPVVNNGTIDGTVGTLRFYQGATNNGVILPTPPPTAPTGLGATAVNYTRIDLGWSDNASTETGFAIQRSTNGVDFAQIATVPANTTNYVNTGLYPLTTYYYWVQATNAVGYSAYSSTASATTPASPLVDLALAMTDAPDPQTVGIPVTYTLTVTNNSAFTATSVVVTDTLPASVSFVSATPSQGTCTNVSTSVTCNLVSVGAQSNANIALVVTPLAGGVITNTAGVSALETDPDPTNNVALAATTIVDPQPPVANFTAVPTTGAAPLQVTFTDLSTGSITNRFWSFGDGGTTNTLATTMAYTYTSAGSYSVGLTVSGPLGSSSTNRLDYVVVTNLPPELLVTPTTGLTSTGPIGGPFSPAAQAYVLTNRGSSSLDWSANKTAGWIDLSATNGTLPGGGAGTVTVSINPTANTLIPSIYLDSVTFTNLTNGAGSTNRTVNLTVLSTATFVGKDSISQGTWKGVYGADGYNVIQDAISYPPYVQVIPTNYTASTLVATTNDVRALQKAADPMDRIVGVWGAPTTFSLRLDLTSSQTHRVALYFLDWGRRGRVQDVDLIDYATGTLLDHRSTGLMEEGVWLVWDIRGSVAVRFTNTAGSNTNAVISGLFFQPPSGSPQPVASFGGTPTNGLAPLTVNFTDTSVGAISDRFWDFGDGVTSNTTLTTLSHTYNSAGTNSVSLKVSGPFGSNTLVRTDYVVVTNWPPQLVVSPTNLTFGTMWNGTKSNQVFTIINGGGGTLTGAASLQDTNSVFAISDGDSYSLGQGGTNLVTISFSPLVPAGYSNAVVFASNGGTSTNLVTGSSTGSATNSWLSSLDGAWHDQTQWSLAVPPGNHQTILVTNATTKIVLLDPTTITNHPQTMIVSNLVVLAPLGTTNTVKLANTGTTTPLRIGLGVRVDSGGVLILSNAALSVESASGTNLNVNGRLHIQGASLLSTTNPAVVAIGAGTITMQNGNMVVSDLRAGTTSGSGGMLTISGGTTRTLANLTAGDSAGSTGAVAIVGGKLITTDATCYLGLAGVGMLSVSNGTMSASTIAIGRLPGSSGTLAIAAGTVGVSTALTVGDSAGGVGNVTITGGQLLITNLASTAILDIRRGMLVLNSGTFSVDRLFLTNDFSSLVVINGGRLSSKDTTVINTAQPFVVGDGVNPTVYNLEGGLHTFADGLMISSNATVSGCGTIDAAVVNHGTLLSSCANGQLVINGVVANDANIATGNGSAIVFIDFMINQGSIVTTNGSVRFFGGVIDTGVILMSPYDDADGDGMNNSWEELNGLNKFSADGDYGAVGDFDHDGFTNLQEFDAGTAPNDGMSFPPIMVSDSNVVISILSVAGETYTLQQREVMDSASDWQDVPGTTQVGNDGILQFTDTGAADLPRRVYRIKVVTP